MDVSSFFEFCISTPEEMEKKFTSVDYATFCWSCLRTLKVQSGTSKNVSKSRNRFTGLSNQPTLVVNATL